MISVIVVSWNTRDLLLSCLESIRAQNGVEPIEIWVVDNASNDGSGEMVCTLFPEVNLISNQTNVGFAIANNRALQQATGRLLVLLNSDTEILPGSLSALTATFATHPQLGICGPQLLNPDGSIQPSWGCFPTPWTEFCFQSFLFKLWPCRFPYGRRVHPFLQPDYGHFRTVDWITGAALMLRRQVFECIGGLPETNFMYGEDLEYCKRARRAGFSVGYQPESKVVHRLSASSHRDYSRWIESYTRAMLGYYQRHSSVGDQWRAAYWMVGGSWLRLVIWSVVGVLWPARRSEARQRCAGYARAMVWAHQVAESRHTLERTKLNE